MYDKSVITEPVSLGDIDTDKDGPACRWVKKSVQRLSTGNPFIFTKLFEVSRSRDFGALKELTWRTHTAVYVSDLMAYATVSSGGNTIKSGQVRSHTKLGALLYHQAFHTAAQLSLPHHCNQQLLHTTRNIIPPSTLYPSTRVWTALLTCNWGSEVGPIILIASSCYLADFAG